jgi:large subunit ribosomal protein L4e
MKVPVYGLDGKVKGEATLGKAFSKPARADVIKKAVLAEESNSRQAYGSDPLAGQRTSANYRGRRGIRNSMMNREMARMKRIVGPGFMHFRARSVPQSVKGRKAHPPKADKNWEKKLNKKERLMALLSAVSCTTDKKLVEARGHKIDEVKHIPLVIDDKLEGLTKNKDVVETLGALGLGKEIERCSSTKTRAGKGKMRGRATIKRKGPIIIIGEDKGISKAASNIPGVDVSTTGNLNVSSLAPGTVPGRLAVWTKSAVEAVEKMTAA